MPKANVERVWRNLCREASLVRDKERLLSSFLEEVILGQKCFGRAVSIHLAMKLRVNHLPGVTLRDCFLEIIEEQENLLSTIATDLEAIRERDPASGGLLNPFLNFKGFHAMTAYRFTHALWEEERTALALFLQSIISERLGVDIHPAAKIGSGILVDHATGVVIGETAVVGDNVSILHGVTLGGTGKDKGDRHPKIGNDVLIGAGAKILGNVSIGNGSKIGAGSVVLEDIPPHTTAVGVPARQVGVCRIKHPSRAMDHRLDEAN